MTRRLVAGALTSMTIVVLAACGGGDVELNGYVREPAPVVDEVALPDLSNDNADFELRAEPDGLLVVYFGYTHCPDVCPTTLADVRLALNRLEPEQAERIDLAMVTVDPDRDLPVLTDYVQSFVPGSHALGTTDGATLAAAAAPFGVAYNVETIGDGDVEVSHSSQAYLVDDEGTLALTWQFGVTPEELASDMAALLDQSS